jgi:hypothetical protein
MLTMVYIIVANEGGSSKHLLELSKILILLTTVK